MIDAGWRTTAATDPLLACGAPDRVLTSADIAEFARALADRVVRSRARRVLVVPPDQTRLHSRAGDVTAALVPLLDPELEAVDVMPALGTHRPLEPADALLMFGDAVAHERLLVHHWREDVTTIGELPTDEVDQLTGHALGLSLPFTVNRALVDGRYDLVVSIGQIVPHEVAGFGGFTKHLCIGLGGGETIQRTHFLSAVHGIERTMGRKDAPARRLIDLGFDRFLAPRCQVLFALTVVESTADGPMLRGLFAGEGGTDSTGGDAYRAAVALSSDVNIETVTEPFDCCVTWLNPAEYRSTWLANKAIYRTRLAMADGGELYVLAPGVTRFGEDDQVDRLIRRHGYHGRSAALAAMADDPELGANLAAVAHLIHGSTEGRFDVIYCPGAGLSRAAIEGVGFRYLPLDDALARFDLDARDGSFTFISDPALGLWRAA